ncbi:MAG: hypothetical protein WCB04_14225 [Mycobacteriales bacterium]
MPERGRLRDLFLAPTPEEPVAKPTREDLHGLPPLERRKRKIEYSAQGGLFRTWVYVAALLIVLVAFTLLIVATG